MAAQFTVGVDVGGTKISSGLVDRRGKIAARFKLATEGSKGKETVLANIEKSVAEVWRPGVAAIGIGLAGLVDHKKGIYLEGPNFPSSFRNVAVASLIRRRFRVPVTIDNDVHCFTLAEAKFGAAKRDERVVGLTLGTGVGGGVVIDGALYRGRDNAAGEFGHMTVAKDAAELCSCGRTGHLEAYASGTAMARIYAKLSGRDAEPLDVERAARAGDPFAAKTFGIMTDGLAAGLANVIHALNPDVIVIGGSIGAIDLLWKPLPDKLRALLVYPQSASTRVVPSALGGDASVLGAAFLAKKK